ncbi:MAG: hypothetical protein ACI9IV_001847, partial [Paracoccaceae bacterium]
GGTRTDSCQTCTDELTHLSDIAFHVVFSLRWKFS